MKYFEIQRDKEVADFSIHKGYKRKMNLELTAVVGSKGRKGVRIDINTLSNIPDENGKGFIVLDTHLEIRSLIDALQARLNGEVTVNGGEQLPSIINGKMKSNEKVILQEVIQ